MPLLLKFIFQEPDTVLGTDSQEVNKKSSFYHKDLVI